MRETTPPNNLSGTFKLPESDSNRQPTGYTFSTAFTMVWTISFSLSREIGRLRRIIVEAHLLVSTPSRKQSVCFLFLAWLGIVLLYYFTSGGVPRFHPIIIYQLPGSAAFFDSQLLCH